MNFDTETKVDSRHAELASKPDMLKSVSTVQDFTHHCLGDCLRESGDFIAVNLDFIHLTFYYSRLYMYVRNCEYIHIKTHSIG